MSANGRRDTVRSPADAGGREDDDRLSRGCVTGGRRGAGRSGSCGSDDVTGSRGGTEVAQGRGGRGERRQGAQDVPAGSRGRSGPGGRTGLGHGDGGNGSRSKNGVVGPGDVNGDSGQCNRGGGGPRDRDFTGNNSADSSSVGSFRRADESSRHSRGDAVTGSGSSRADSCDVDVSSNKDDCRGGSSLRGRNDGGNDGASTAGGATVCRDRGDASPGEDSQNQSAFVRQQRMKWLEANCDGAAKQSDTPRSQLPTATERSHGPSATKSSGDVSSGCRPEKPVATSGERLGVVSRRSDAVASRLTTESTTGRHRPTTRPALTNRVVGTDVEPGNGDKSGKNCADRNQVRSCSRTGSGEDDGVDSGGGCRGHSDGIKVTVFGTTNDVSKGPTAAAVEESSDDQKPRCLTSSYCGTVDRQRTDAESQRRQQSVRDAGATDSGASASLKVASVDDRRFSETRRTPAAVQVQEVATMAAASICSDRPMTDLPAPLSTQNDVGVTSSTRHSTEAPTTSDSAEPKTADMVSPGLHDAFDNVDSGTGSEARSVELPNSSRAISLSFDTPLIEDEFDIYMKEDGLDVWLQGGSASQLLDARHDVVSIDPTEGFADSDDETLLKLPASSTSENGKPGEVCSAAETRADCQSVGELAQSLTSDTPNVETSAGAVKAPPSRAKLWTCVYSRECVGVGEVSTRFSPAYCDAEVQNSVPDDATTAVASVGGSGAKNERASEKQFADSPVCCSSSYQNTAVTESTFNDTNQAFSKETSRCDKPSQELVSSTQEQLISISAENVDEKSSEVIPMSSTTVTESFCSEVNAADKPAHVDSIDSLNSVPVDEPSRLSAAGSPLEDTEYEIPAEMEADFIDQMCHETCPNVAPSSTEDSSAETLLNIVVTHVVDARHFWGQIVNEGIQVCAVNVSCTALPVVS